MKFINTSLVASAVVALHLSGVGCGNRNEEGSKTNSVHGNGGPLAPDNEGKISKTVNLKERAKALGISIQSFAELSAEIQKLAGEIGDQDAFIKIAIQAALDHDDKTMVPEGSDKKAYPGDYNVQVAQAIRGILSMPYKEKEKRTTNVIANCPPESVTINGNLFKRDDLFDPKDEDVRFISEGYKYPYVWSKMMPTQDELIQAQIARIDHGANFVELVPIDKVEGLSDECRDISMFKKPMELLTYKRQRSITYDWNLERNLTNAIQLGIHALEAFRAIHEAGVVFGRREISHYIQLKNPYSIDWTDPEQLAINGFGGSHQYLWDPSLSLLEISSHSKNEKMSSDGPKYMSPGEIRGYKSTRADDLYRLSETLFNACRSFLYVESGEVDSILAKKNWKLSWATIEKPGAYEKAQERGPKDNMYFEVLNAFHQEMFELSYSRFMDKPDYQEWINRFEAALHQN